MYDKQKAVFNFVSVNIFMVLVAFLAWKAGLIVNLDQLPQHEYIMMGFLIFFWFIGLIFCLLKSWDTVYLVANTIPIWALICLGLNIYIPVASAHEISSEVAFNILKAAGQGVLINSFGIFLMLWLKKLAYFMGDEHV
jgi:hypothetical protein